MASTLFSCPETTFWSLGGQTGAVSVFLVLVSIFLIPWLIIPPSSVLQNVSHDGQYNKLPVVLTRCPRPGGNCQCIQGPQKGSWPHSGWSHRPLSHCRAVFPLSMSLTIFLPDVSFLQDVGQEKVRACGFGVDCYLLPSETVMRVFFPRTCRSQVSW